MIVLDLWRKNYRISLITYLKFTKKCKACAKRRKVKSECDFIGLKNNKLNYKCKECKKIYFTSINGLIKKFSNMYQFCGGDINKFVLLLRRGVFPYEYIDSWEKFNETPLPAKKAFYSELNLEDITDEDYAHYQKVFKKLGLKTLEIVMTYVFNAIHYYFQMYLNTLETSVSKYMNLTLLIFCLHQN